MSEQDASAHSDPLVALRAQDHRPVSEVWRARFAERIQGGIAPPRLPESIGRWVWALLAVPVVVAVGWQAYVATDPPVEDTLPIAQSSDPPELDESSLPQVSAEVSGQVSAGAEPGTESVELVTAPSEVVVHVAGAVRNPGLVVGEMGWRVDDAVAAAGGATTDADLDRLNLAAFIADGERLFVPRIGEQVPQAVVDESGASASAESAMVNVNTADVAALQTLPGIGPVTAATIIEHRNDHGPFAAVEAILAVRGIGPATLDQLRGYVTVG